MWKKPINYKIKGYFDKLKKEKRVTSIQLAAALQVSRTTMSAMSGRLDEISLTQVFKIAETLNIDPASFAVDIVKLHKQELDEKEK